MKEIQVTVQRFNPDDNKGSYEETFTFEVQDGLTILDALNKIKWEIDGTLTHRMSCRSAICGSCAVRVNGKSKLACKSQLDEFLIDNKISIGPIGNTEILKDLVVDLEPFWGKLHKVKPWLDAPMPKDTTKENYQSHEGYKKIEDASTCILCACCISECNSLKADSNYVGPAALAKAQRFIDDSRDRSFNARLRAISEPTKVWDCTHCGECSERCPTDAKPLHRIEELRERVVNAGIQNNNGARHLLSFFSSVGSSGTLDERKIPIESVGMGNTDAIISDVLPVGLKMLSHGKNPPLLHHNVDNVKEVRKLFKKLNKLP